MSRGRSWSSRASRIRSTRRRTTPSLSPSISHMPGDGFGQAPATTCIRTSPASGSGTCSISWPVAATTPTKRCIACSRNVTPIAASGSLICTSRQREHAWPAGCSPPTTRSRPRRPPRPSGRGSCVRAAASGDPLGAGQPQRDGYAPRAATPGRAGRQALLGEVVRILEVGEDWHYVRLEHDGYMGWVQASALYCCGREEASPTAPPSIRR